MEQVLLGERRTGVRRVDLVDSPPASDRHHPAAQHDTLAAHFERRHSRVRDRLCPRHQGGPEGRGGPWEGRGPLAR